MLERYGDIWEAAEQDKPDAVVITTNGFVKKNGEAVIGSGIALEAKNRYPTFSKDLGNKLTEYGNIPFTFVYPESSWRLLTLPTKPTFGPNGLPGWKAGSEIDLIRTSMGDLVNYLIPNIEVLFGDMNLIYMPRPGCGSGRLKWEDVKPMIEPYLDDRFVVFHKRDK